MINIHQLLSPVCNLLSWLYSSAIPWSSSTRTEEQFKNVKSKCMANLVVYFTQILWTEFNEFSMNRKLLHSRLQICDLPGPTQGFLSCYGRESSEDSQQWKTLQLLFVQAISLLTSLLQTSWSKMLAFNNGERRDRSIVICKTQYTADETWSELELRKLLKFKLFHSRKIPESSTSVLSTGAVLLLPKFHDIQSTETGAVHNTK